MMQTWTCIEPEVRHSLALLGITGKATWYNHLGLKDPPCHLANPTGQSQPSTLSEMPSRSNEGKRLSSKKYLTWRNT